MKEFIEWYMKYRYFYRLVITTRPNSKLLFLFVLRNGAKQRRFTVVLLFEHGPVVERGQFHNYLRSVTTQHKSSKFFI